MTNRTGKKQLPVLSFNFTNWQIELTYIFKLYIAINLNNSLSLLTFQSNCANKRDHLIFETNLNSEIRIILFGKTIKYLTQKRIYLFKILQFI